MGESGLAKGSRKDERRIGGGGGWRRVMREGGGERGDRYSRILSLARPLQAGRFVRRTTSRNYTICLNTE